MQNKTTKSEVEKFLVDFHQKMKVFGILFLGREKNFQTLAELEITAHTREKVLEELSAEDFSEGPLEENFYGGKEMWVFGKTLKQKEIYIKITMGMQGSNCICISFHLAEHRMKYPFKTQ